MNMQPNMNQTEMKQMKLWVEYMLWSIITYQFPNFNGCTIDVWEWISITEMDQPLSVIIWMLCKLRPKQDVHCFSNNIFGPIFLNESCILFWNSLKFIPKSSIDNKWALAQIMVGGQTSNKPLSGPVMTWITHVSGISLGMGPANERRCYIVTTSLIGWTHN